ncbi:MAG: carboxypeptidase-like regulatory domain-containing protein, partial [Lachnospiraceae bacterium]
MDKGKLSVRVYDAVTLEPLENASVNIAYTGDPQSPLERTVTDQSGKTQDVELDAPPLEYSMSPGEVQPYAEYTITVEKSGYAPRSVSGTEIFSGETGVLDVLLDSRTGNIVIPAHTLWGNYPPKIAESEVKPINRPGEIVLSRVVVPETIVVHDGVP